MTVPEGLAHTIAEDSTDCAHPADAVKWNHYNARYQCHRCGAIVSDPPDPLTTRCAVAGCELWPIDVRGPVFIGGLHWVCTEHWEAIIGIVGRQVTRDDDAFHYTPEETP